MLPVFCTMTVRSPVDDRASNGSMYASTIRPGDLQVSVLHTQAFTQVLAKLISGFGYFDGLQLLRHLYIVSLTCL